MRPLASELRAVYGHRPWIVAVDVLAGATPVTAALRDLDAGPLMVVAGTEGTGPAPDDAEILLLGTGGASVMSSLRNYEAALVSLPAEARARIDAWDPTREARVLPSLTATVRSLAGREVFGPRARSWIDLEDKSRIDDLWDAVGVDRAPSRVVEAEPGALRGAARDLDDGEGTVWVADNRRGWHGGAEYLRWVRSSVDADLAISFFGHTADRVRVMPFLEGIPCSIHGFVFPDDVAVFRPAEMVVLRRPGDSVLRYAASATFWDPPVTDRIEMVETARRVGRHLANTLDYRGAFTVDGVLTAEGFRPTELNPRYGAALSLLAAAADLPLYLTHLAVVDGAEVDWDPRAIERNVVEVADRVRMGGGRILVDVPLREQREQPIRWDGAGYHPCEPDEADSLLSCGPAATGGLVRLELDHARHRRGPSVGPKVCAAFRLADELWSTGIGSLEPARDVRRAVAGEPSSVPAE